MVSKISKAFNKLEYRKLLHAFSLQKTRAVVHPFHPHPSRQKHPGPAQIFVYDYNAEKLSTAEPKDVRECYAYRQSNTISWVNLDCPNKTDIESLSLEFGIHPLLQEDILSHGQRPKMDEIDNVLFVLLNMVFMEENTGEIEQEQISIVLGENFVISFQEDATRDVFDPIRARLQITNSKLRQTQADHLFYSLIDIIVNSYYQVIEKLGEQIEKVEEQIMLKATPHTFASINQLRKDIILIRRNTGPMRDMISNIIRSESELLNDRTTKYFKDVYDHVVQANDLTENYRDLIMGLQDMYMNSVNLKTNEIMKTLAIITAVMAPATVIGGIFGMNFDIIPYMHHEWGFYGTVTAMLVIPLLMIWRFKRRGWFAREIPEKPEEK